MAQIEYIKYLYENEEKSLREIAEITGTNFRTVRKYAYMSNWSPEHMPSVEAARYPVLKDYIPSIDKWLKEDKRRPRKQRHTVMRIYHRLQEEEGFAGSYSSVKKYVQKKRYLEREGTGGYLPLEQPKGNAQDDFGAFAYYAGGEERTGYALTLSFPYSNAGFTQVYPSQNQECLLEGLKRIFEKIGGVPQEIKADNMSSAVAQVLKGTERILSEGFSRFMLHYRFRAVFCNPASGNEKGNVENKVGYSRRNYFVPMPAIEDFETYNEGLWQRCEKDHERQHYKKERKIQELWEEEQEHLLYLPEDDYPVYRYEACRLNNYGFATVDTNRYGLPPELAGQTIYAKIYFNRIEFWYEHRHLKTYNRCYGHNEELLDWTQYVEILCRKPGGAEHARFFKQLPELWQKHLKESRGKERKNALRLLREIVTDGNSGLCNDVVSLAEEYGRSDADTMRQCYYLIAKKENFPVPLDLGPRTLKLNYTPDLGVYDSLAGGDGHGRKH